MSLSLLIGSVVAATVAPEPRRHRIELSRGALHAMVTGAIRTATDENAEVAILQCNDGDLRRYPVGSDKYERAMRSTRKTWTVLAAINKDSDPRVAAKTVVDARSKLAKRQKREADAAAKKKQHRVPPSVRVIVHNPWSKPA